MSNRSIEITAIGDSFYIICKTDSRNMGEWSTQKSEGVGRVAYLWLIARSTIPEMGTLLEETL